MARRTNPLEELVTNLPGPAAIVTRERVDVANADWLAVDRSTMCAALRADPHFGRPSFTFPWFLPVGTAKTVTATRVGADAYLVHATDSQAQAPLVANRTGLVDAALFDHLDEGVLILDPDGQVTVANEAAQRQLGLTLDQLRRHVAPDGWIALGEDDRPLLMHELPGIETLRTQRPTPPTVIGIHVPGRPPTHLRCQAIPMRTNGERVMAGVFVSFVEVSPGADSERVAATLRRSRT